MKNPTLDEILEIASFEYDEDGNLVLTRLNTHLIGDHIGDHEGNHVGDHVGIHYGNHEGTHIGKHEGDHVGNNYGNHVGKTYNPKTK